MLNVAKDAADVLFLIAALTRAKFSPRTGIARMGPGLGTPHRQSWHDQYLRLRSVVLPRMASKKSCHNVLNFRCDPRYVLRQTGSISTLAITKGALSPSTTAQSSSCFAIIPPFIENMPHVLEPHSNHAVLATTQDAATATFDRQSNRLGEVKGFNVDLLETSSKVLQIICRYRLHTHRRDGSGAPEPLSTNFLAQVYAKVQSNQPILMCLPAFPFKSPNTRTKVLGRLPDKAEEFALAHLDGLCAAIKHEYAPGAQLMIISDGLVYNGQCLAPSVRLRGT